MKSAMKLILKKWYIYLIAIIVAVTGSIYYCNFINMPRNEETISIFLSSYSSNNEKLFTFLKEKSPSYLREVSILSISPKSPDFDYFMVNKGLNKADIFILHESYLFDELIKKQFASLNNEVVANYFNYSSDSSNKGILIHEKNGDDHGLITFKSTNYEDENFYMFFRINSLHIKGLYEKAKVDTALLFAKELLNYEEK